jgi:hypothetical protein
MIGYLIPAADLFLRTDRERASWQEFLAARAGNDEVLPQRHRRIVIQGFQFSEYAEKPVGRKTSNVTWSGTSD